MQSGGLKDNAKKIRLKLSPKFVKRFREILFRSTTLITSQPNIQHSSCLNFGVKNDPSCYLPQLLLPKIKIRCEQNLSKLFFFFASSQTDVSNLFYCLVFHPVIKTISFYSSLYLIFCMNFRKL